jgi:hypothetical protein
MVGSLGWSCGVGEGTSNGIVGTGVWLECCMAFSACLGSQVLIQDCAVCVHTCARPVHMLSVVGHV